jgi:hypothetical protein
LTTVQLIHDTTATLTQNAIKILSDLRSIYAYGKARRRRPGLTYPAPYAHYIDFYYHADEPWETSGPHQHVEHGEILNRILPGHIGFSTQCRVSFQFERYTMFALA